MIDDCLYITMEEFIQNCNTSNRFAKFDRSADIVMFKLISYGHLNPKSGFLSDTNTRTTSFDSTETLAALSHGLVFRIKDSKLTVHMSTVCVEGGSREGCVFTCHSEVCLLQRAGKISFLYTSNLAVKKYRVLVEKYWLFYWKILTYYRKILTF